MFTTSMRDAAAAGRTAEKVENASKAAESSPFAVDAAAAAAAVRQVQVGMGTAFIGGGCCVHLSIEYTPSSATATSGVAVLVQGSDETLLAWFKVEQPGVGYQIKECIVTTKPGADLTVVVVDMTARVRWCEVFSC